MNDSRDILKICTYPDPILKTCAEPILNIDGKIKDLAEKMIETMYAAPGIGLAANQVGELKRIIVFNLYPREEGEKPGVLINPEIIVSEGEIIREEACLSVIDFSAEVTRKAKIKVKGFNLQGKPIDIEADGLLAICLQHEIDHLNGILFIDHISSLKRSLYKRRLKKMLKAT